MHRAHPSATATGFCPFLYIFKESFLYFEEETVPHLIRNANRAVPQSGREPGLLYRYKSNSFQSFPKLMRIQRALSKISYRERFIAGLFPARSYLPFGYSRRATRSNLKQLKLFSTLFCSYLSSEIQHRCRIDAVVSRTSRDVRTRQNISP